MIIESFAFFNLFFKRRQQMKIIMARYYAVVPRVMILYVNGICNEPDCIFHINY